MRSDSLRAEIQVRNAQNAIADAVNAIATGEAALTRTVGTPYLVTASPADTVDLPEVTLDDTELRALADSSPSVIEAQKAYEAAKAAKKSSYTDYLPSISMGYSRGGSGTSGEFDPFGTGLDYNGSVRFSVAFPCSTSSSARRRSSARTSRFRTPRRSCATRSSRRARA